MTLIEMFQNMAVKRKAIGLGVETDEIKLVEEMVNRIHAIEQKFENDFDDLGKSAKSEISNIKEIINKKMVNLVQTEQPAAPATEQPRPHPQP